MFDLMNRNYLNSYNPFRMMDEMERSFFNNQDLAEFKTDISDDGDHFLLEADLPGFDKKDIKLELQGDTLIINAERHSNAEEKNKDGKVVRMERSYGSYSRQFDMSGIDTDHIGAKYENGVLSLTLPKIQATLPETRQLEIE